MADHPCARCGAATQGEASITIHGVTAYYCHEAEGDTCYMLADRAIYGATQARLDRWLADQGIDPLTIDWKWKQNAR